MDAIFTISCSLLPVPSYILVGPWRCVPLNRAALVGTIADLGLVRRNSRTICLLNIAKTGWIVSY